ncbi:MAG: YIP1 family protein [Gammaproteobacteria bacterium]|nr:YIP1 family protein [Gammaproteobacteria bacterium]
MTGNSYSVFNAMVDIVASPGKALDEIKLHTAWLWWPLLISLLLGSGLMIYYYSWVDFPWLVEETIRGIPAENRAESADAIRQFMQPGRSTWTTVIAIVVVTLIIYTIQSTYLHLANKLITGADIRFGQWFSFSTWTAFVGVFGALAAFVLIFMADSNQLSQQSLQVLSINSLLVHASPGDPWFTWASSLTLINFWTLFLMSIGFARWTGAGMVKSTIIAITPWVLIFGIWALMI